MIRRFQADDAAGVVALVHAVDPQRVQTEEGLDHWLAHQPPEARAAQWVVLADGGVAGWAQAELVTESSEEGIGWIWVGVLPAVRRRGLGRALHERAEQHLAAAGGQRLVAYADERDEGFLLALGYTRTRTSFLLSLDPAEADVSELARLERAKAGEGFRLAPLGEAHDRERELHRLFAAGAADVPSDVSWDRIPFERWRRRALGRPELALDASAVVLAADGLPVSMSWLAVDPDAHLANVIMTATLPPFRGRRLARLAKVATVAWAARAGVRELVTENDAANAPMLALNESVGFRRAATLGEYVGRLPPR